MQNSEAEFIVARLTTGWLKFRIDGQIFFLKSPSPYNKYTCNEIYETAYHEATEDGMPSEDELLDELIDKGLWDVEKEKFVKKVKEDIENLKVQMFEKYLNTQALIKGKEVLKNAKKDLIRLHEERHALSFLSREGFANMERNKYFIAASVYYKDNSPLIFNEEDYWLLDNYIVEQAMLKYRETRLEESQLRWVARNEPWRSIWSSRKAGLPLFDKSCGELNEEQRSIIVWSMLYDNISEHTECPSDDIINDDDVLDGWMILQRRKRKKEEGKRWAESLIKNENISNSGEVFVMANPEGERLTLDQLKQNVENVSNLNDEVADIQKRQRMSYLRKKGKVHEEAMPDSKLEIVSQWHKMHMSHLKGK